MRAQNIANVMSKIYGLTIESVTESDYFEDGEIKFEEFPNSHIQVGEGYTNVVKTEGTSFIFLEERRAIEDLYNDLRK